MPISGGVKRILTVCPFQAVCLCAPRSCLSSFFQAGERSLYWLHPHLKLPGVRRKQLLRYNLELPFRASRDRDVALIRTLREQFCQIVDKCKFPGGYGAQQPALVQRLRQVQQRLQDTLPCTEVLGLQGTLTLQARVTGLGKSCCSHKTGLLLAMIAA
jgi:hypothetical protein